MSSKLIDPGRSASGLVRSGVLLCLVGPAGSGKTTFCKRLEHSEAGTARVSVSVTSREKRPGEEDGKAYHFVSGQEFRSRIERGYFFEWEEVHGNLYGTPQATIDTALAGGLDFLFDVDIRGALNLKRKVPHNTAIVFILPPSFAVLKDRLLGRGAISKQEFNKRLETASKEYALFLGEGRDLIDYAIVNDEAENTFQQLKSILTAERHRLSRMSFESVRALCVIDKGSD